MAPCKPPKTSRELETAVYDDFKKQAIDCAKKRAVGQRVDYDTFKNMVSVAHLKPLQARSDKKDGAMLPSWQFAADGSQLPADGVSPDEGRLPVATPHERPSTSSDFCRDWRRNCTSCESRYKYLLLCGPECLRSIFKIEIPVDVLRDVLDTLEACWLRAAGTVQDTPDGRVALQKAAAVMALLQAISSAGRFPLTVRLLPATSKPAISSLLDGLQRVQEASAAATEAEGGHGIAGDVRAQVQLPLGDQQQLDTLRVAYGLRHVVT